MSGRRSWGLRHHLSAMLVASMALTFVLIGLVVVLWRAPHVEHAALQDLRQDAVDVAERLELLLGARQARLELYANLLRGKPSARAGALLEASVREGRRFRAVYKLSLDGKVEVVGPGEGLSAQADDFLGTDLSASALYRAVQGEQWVAWSGRFLSALTGELVVGVALRDVGGQVLIGEVPIPALLQELRAVADPQETSVWVVDRSGELVVDTEGRHMGRLNLQNWPLLQAASRGEDAVGRFVFEGQSRQGAVAHAPSLDWFVFASGPRGWSDPLVRRSVYYVLASFAGCVAMGLLLAPVWARRLARPLQDIVEQAALTTRGRSAGRSWPRGPVAEFNRLSEDLEAMAMALQEREYKLQALFNVAPVPMAVADADDDHSFLDVNAVWTEEVGYTRAEVLGLNSIELGLWASPFKRDELLGDMHGDTVSGEIEIVCKNGQTKLFRSYGRMLRFKDQRLMVWGSINIGPLRQVEQELRALNEDLEARVEQRTAALQSAHAELSATLAQLQATQAELVRTEKMAALGGLVAGVAHEINTPLGNSVMAVSAMEDATRRLAAALPGGLRRADLSEWLEGVEQGSAIAGRNLRRAAELVQSFKQVAVDQTSAQRRSFALGDVVHELVASLRPSYARTAYRFEVDIPTTGLRMDSYPGALGQALGQLLQNAVEHGFEGRAHGTVRISAGRAADQRVWLRVADDGRGIAPELLGRIFDPFMTTRMGQGGTGLGLHISYNAVVKLLGGTLTVESKPGQGCCFELRLPDVAPLAQPEGATLAQAGAA